MGESQWDIDWDLGRFDPDIGHHIGEIRWDVRSAVGASGQGGVDGVVLRILQVVKDNEFGYTKSQVVAAAGGKREQGFKKINELEANGALILRRVPGGKGDRVGLGANGEKLFGAARWGTDSSRKRTSTRGGEPTGTDKQ